MFSCILTCSHGVRTRENAREHARIKGQKSVGELAEAPKQPEPEAVSQTWEKSAAFFGVTGGEILAIAVGYHTTL